MVTRRIPSRLPASAPAAETPPPPPVRRLSRLPATSELPEYERETPHPAVRTVRRIQTPADLFPEAAAPVVTDEIAAERAKQEASRDRTDYDAIMQDYKDRTGNSRRKAIRAFCVWCCVGQTAEVKRCAATQCPLHGFRMGRTPEAQAREDAKEGGGSDEVVEGGGDDD